MVRWFDDFGMGIVAVNSAVRGHLASGLFRASQFRLESRHFCGCDGMPQECPRKPEASQNEGRLHVVAVAAKLSIRMIQLPWSD